MGGYVQLSGQPGGSGYAREFLSGAPHEASPAPPFLARVEERGLEAVRTHCLRAENLSRTTTLAIGVNQPQFRHAFIKLKGTMASL
eukprot:7254646-Alexandrium_andersonii.AAC.1